MLTAAKLLGTLVMLLLCAVPPAARAEPTAPADAAGGGFAVGVCTHFVQRKGLLPENLRMIREAGVTSIRDEVPWSQVEKEPGVFAIPERVDAYVDAAREAGLEVMLVLGYGNRFYEEAGKPKSAESIDAYLAYARFVVGHFKGRVRQYEVWNEWNIGIGTAKGEAGTPDGYLALLRAAYPAIKQADPDAEVIGGVVAPQAFGDGFWDRLLELGLTDHCNAVSVHTYNYAANPAERRTPEAWFERVTRVADAVAQRRPGMPIYVTEHGWPTNTGPTGTGPHVAGDYLARVFLLARTLPALRGVWWYDFQDDGWKRGYNEDNFGLVRPDLTPKPAYFALATIAGLASGAHSLGAADLPAESSDLRALRFGRAGGGEALAIWSIGEPLRVTLEPRDGADATAATLIVTGRPAVERAWQDRDWVGQPQAPVEAQIALTATGTPIIVGVERGGAAITAVRPLQPPQ